MSIKEYFIALVDNEDYSRLAQFTWRPLHSNNGKIYALRSGRGNFLMHRIIMNPSNDEEIDHIDNNGLNNRKQNLRIATSMQNQANSIKPPIYTSEYKGVWWYKNKVWTASIRHKHLGYFDSEIEAAKAYDRAAIQIFGEFARLNFP